MSGVSSESPSRPRPSVSIVGGGEWGVALGVAARRAGAEVTLHTRRKGAPAGIHATESFADVAKSKLVIVAVPSNVVRASLRQLGDHLDGTHLLVHGIRGLESETLSTVSEIAREETPVRRLGALGGPVQAHELRHGRPSAMVIGSHYPEVTQAVTGALQHTALRVYATPDVKGLEWASALVGCVAVGVGFAEQAGAGPGLIAALISRGVDEAAKIATAAGAEEKTMYGLGGYGDLLASIALDDRPEVVLGKALARGKSLDDAVTEAKLRVEAITLIPKVAAFAKQAKVAAGAFDALASILGGAQPAAILERLFAVK